MSLSAARSWVERTTTDAASAPRRRTEGRRTRGRLRRRRPRPDRGAARSERRRTGAPALLGGLDGRLHRLRPRLRLPREPRLDLRRPAAGDAANAGAARVCGPGRWIHRRLPARHTGRMAAHRRPPTPRSSIRMPHPPHFSHRERACGSRRSPHGTATVQRRVETAGRPRSLEVRMQSRGREPRGSGWWSRDCWPPFRISAGRALHRSGSPRRAPSTAARARTANRLVGNPEGAAVIEATMGGLRAVADRDLWFAVTGAWGPILLDGHEVDPYEAHAWHAGVELQLGLVRARRPRLPRGARRDRCRGGARIALDGRALRDRSTAPAGRGHPGRRRGPGRPDPDRGGRAVGCAPR